MIEASEVKAAVERARGFFSGNLPSLCHDDYKTLASAYLSSHHADSETPIDEEWLRSVGFTGDDYDMPMPSHAGYPGDLSMMTSGWAFITQYEKFDGEDDDSCVQVRCKTRGDVRRLCAALGIELKEKASA